MALIKYSVTLVAKQDAPYNVLPDTDISIRKVSDESLVQIYSDEAGLVPIAQPGAKTDSRGVFEFYTDSLPVVKAEWSDGVNGYSEVFNGNSLQLLSGLADPSDLDTVHRSESTIAKLSSGVHFPGSKLVLSDLAYAKFDVVIGGTPNGTTIRDAGNGNTAVLIPSVPINLSEYGYSFDTSSIGFDGVRAVSLGGRLGDLVYSYSAEPKLLSNLKGILPEAEMLNTAPYETITETFLTSGTWLTTGNPNVFRTVVSGKNLNDLERPYYITFDNGDSLNSVGYPTTDSVSVYNAGADLHVDVYLSSAISPTGAASVYIKRVDNGYNQQKNRIFVDPINGNDSFWGKSFEYPYKTIQAAISAGADIVVLKDGLYVNNNNIGTYTEARDISFICPNGRAKIVSNSVTFSSWALESGSVYYTDVGGSPTPVGVADLTHTDEFGLPIIPTSTASIAECQATPNSFYYDASFPRRMYCNLIDGSAPSDTETIVLTLVVIARHSAPSHKVYMENIDCIGGSGGGITARNTDVNAVLVAKNCTATGSNKNGFDILDVGICLSIDCAAAYNDNDGFNYTEFNGLSPHFIEIGGVGYRNKEVGTGNGSTSHDDCVGFRINCDYFENLGPGMVDVGNSITHNVNISSNNNATFGAQADGSAQVSINGIISRGNSIDVTSTNGGTIKIRDYSIEKFSGAITQL